MDRSAVFVDAGYLYAEGGKLCHGTRSRRMLLLDAAGMTDHLCKLAVQACGLTILRTYWYDGAKGGVATTAQQVVAGLPNLKLRLGRLNARMEQKGVDALIYRDLMTLARERAISDAFLLSGDEDLREGVRAAQDMGVRVTLIGIAPVGQDFNQSRDLVHEADEVVILRRSDLIPFLRRRRLPPAGPVSSANPFSEVRSSAVEFAGQWASRATTAQLVALHADRPRIPQLLDAELLETAEHALGASLQGHQELRRATRGAFWDAVPAPPPVETGTP